MFGLLMERRASLNDPRFNLNDPSAWEQLFGDSRDSESGVQVSHRKVMGLDPCWQAVTMISNDVAKLPLDIFRRGENGEREVDDYHPAWRLICREANPLVTAFDFWRRLLFHACVWGNGYAWIDRNGRGDPIGLYNLLPDRTGPEVVNGQLVYVTETCYHNGDPWLRPLLPENVIHLQGPGYDLWQGEDPAHTARDSFGLALATQKFTSKFYRHGVRTGGILEVPQGTSVKSAENLERDFTKHHTTEDGWFKTVVLRDGAKFHQTSIPPNEAQMNETVEASARNAARRWNMAPSLLGVIDSHGYGSKQDDTQAYLDRTLSPWMKGITSQCYSKLLSAKQKWADSHYFEHNSGALLTMNMLQRYQVYALGLRNKILVPNEARAMENMNPMEGGDKPLEAYGAGKQGAPGDNQTNQHTGEKPAGEPTTPSDAAGSKAARMRFIFKLTERARHKSHRTAAFWEWISRGLGSFTVEASKAGVSAADVAAFEARLMDLTGQVKTDEQLLRAVDMAAEEFENQHVGDV